MNEDKSALALQSLRAAHDLLLRERDHFREAWAAAQVRIDCGTDAVEAVREERAAVVALLRERDRLRAEVRDLERENAALRRRLREGGR